MLHHVALVRTDVTEEFSASFIRVTRIGEPGISIVLARHNIKSVGLPHVKLSSLLRPLKDNLGLKTLGVYRIPCECGRVYIGQAGHFMDIRLMEH
jgi:hypothetical protein